MARVQIIAKGAIIVSFSYESFMLNVEEQEAQVVVTKSLSQTPAQIVVMCKSDKGHCFWKTFEQRFIQTFEQKFMPILLGKPLKFTLLCKERSCPPGPVRKSRLGSIRSSLSFLIANQYWIQLHPSIFSPISVASF